MRVSVEPIPLTFSVVGGDVVQNLRSALDYLVWQLVLIDGEKPGTHTAFPIYTSKSKFDKRVRNPPKNRPSPLAGIEPKGEKWTLLEGFQPYEREEPPEIDPLAILASFSNRDKHRGLLAGVSFMHDLDFDRICEPYGDVVDFRVTFPGPEALEHDAEVARFRVSASPSTQSGVKMHGDPPFEVTLSDGDLAVSVPTFDRIRADVVIVIRAFERFF